LISRAFSMSFPAIRFPHTISCSARGKGSGSRRKSSGKGSKIPAKPTGKGESEEAKVSAAAKIQAARSLARKLSDERSAAAAAADLLSKHVVDGATSARLKLDVENEVATFAKEAGSADAVARIAKQSGGRLSPSSVDLEELERLKRENAELQALLLQLARDREEAEMELEARMKDLNVKADSADSMGTGKAGEAGEAAKAAGAALSRKTQKRTKRGGSGQLSDAMAAAIESGQAFSVIPEAPVPVGSEVRVLYCVERGPLPNESAVPVLKIGFNRWESVEQFSMEPLSEDNGKGWFVASVKLPPLLFRVDFVIEDKNSGAVDNNNGQDFGFELDNAPTAEEVTARRVKLLDEFEQKMSESFAKEEDAIEAAAMKAAKGLAKEARITFAGKRKEQILQEAKHVVQERRQGNVKESSPGAFLWSKPPTAGSVVTLFYNKVSGPLASASSITAMIGYDSWWMQDTEAVPMVPASVSDLPSSAAKSASVADGDWVKADISVWNTAALLDFAFCDGNRQAWDNAGGEDYHTRVANATPAETLVQLVFEALLASDDSSFGEEMAAKRVLQRASMRCAAARKRRELQRRFLFTIPMSPQAGKKATIYYNPDRTLLRGRPEVFISGSFNRSSHPETIEPMLMTEAVLESGGLGFLKAIVDIPADAHTLDLKFSDSNDMHGGFFDSNKGLGYHVPVSGSSSSAKPLYVAHIASEMAPIAKAGGLGDVVTALGRAVQQEGHGVEIVIPKYDCIDYSQVEDLVLDREFMWDGIQVKVWKGVVEELPTTFLEPCNGIVWMGSIYTNMDGDRNRFGVFCACALHYLLSESSRGRPSLLHCHDWQSAPIAFMDRQGIPAAFTIHNMDFGADLISGAVQHSEVSTTVSPTYAVEISGHPGISPHLHKFYGIRNGIDVDIWDPSSDAMLPINYSIDNFEDGKAAAKKALRERMNLADGDVPIVGCVTRLTGQKGIHLIKHAAWRAMERGAQFVLLGSAPDPAIQADFNQLAEDLKTQYPDRSRLHFAYDEPLSHLIFAGSDMFLVPSMFEPCGLTQMIAMRFGTVPVVRRTGGLADTVMDYDDDAEKAESMGMEVNGFSFDGSDAAGIDYALNRAFSLYFSDREAWRILAQRGMSIDWSWTGGPSQEYVELYHRAIAAANSSN
jgi:starch synthase